MAIDIILLVLFLFSKRASIARALTPQPVPTVELRRIHREMMSRAENSK